MLDLLIRIVINAVGLYVAIQVVPQIVFKFGDDWWKLGAVALVFALVNSYLKPIVKALSFPISLMTLGAIGFVINAGMLLLTALLSNQLGLGFKIDSFPPDVTADAFVGALLGAVIISAVATVLGLANFGRKLVF